MRLRLTAAVELQNRRAALVTSAPDGGLHKIGALRTDRRASHSCPGNVLIKGRLKRKSNGKKLQVGDDVHTKNKMS